MKKITSHISSYLEQHPRMLYLLIGFEGYAFNMSSLIRQASDVSYYKLTVEFFLFWLYAIIMFYIFNSVLFIFRNLFKSPISFNGMLQLLVTNSLLLIPVSILSMFLVISGKMSGVMLITRFMYDAPQWWLKLEDFYGYLRLLVYILTPILIILNLRKLQGFGLIKAVIAVLLAVTVITPIYVLISIFFV